MNNYPLFKGFLSYFKVFKYPIHFYDLKINNINLDIDSFFANDILYFSYYKRKDMQKFVELMYIDHSELVCCSKQEFESTKKLLIL